MQKGFEGNKTEMIDKGAQQWASTFDCVTLDLLEDQITKVRRSENAYQKSIGYSRLNYLIERAAKEGVK